MAGWFCLIMGVAALVLGIYMDKWHDELNKQFDDHRQVAYSDYLVSGFGILLIIAAVIFMIPASILICIATYI